MTSNNPMPDALLLAFEEQLDAYPTGLTVIDAATGAGKTTATARHAISVAAEVIENDEKAPWVSSISDGWKTYKKVIVEVKTKEDRDRFIDDLYSCLSDMESTGELSPSLCKRIREGIFVAESSFDSECAAFRDPNGIARTHVAKLLKESSDSTAWTSYQGVCDFFENEHQIMCFSVESIKKEQLERLRSNLSTVRRNVQRLMLRSFSDFEKNKKNALAEYKKLFPAKSVIEASYIETAERLLAPWKKSKRAWFLAYKKDELSEILESSDMSRLRAYIVEETRKQSGLSASYDSDGILKVIAEASGEKSAGDGERPWAWVVEVYKQSGFIDCLIAVMTTMKYCCYYNTVTDGSFLPKGADKAHLFKCVYIDESDSAYRTLLEAMVSDKVNSSPARGDTESDADIFEIVRSAYFELNKQMFPDKAVGEIDVEYGVEVERAAVLDANRFKDFILRVVPDDKRWLEKAFKVLERCESTLVLNRNYLYKSDAKMVNLFSTADYTVSPVPRGSNSWMAESDKSGGYLTPFIERNEGGSINEIVYVPSNDDRDPRNRLDSEIRAATHTLRSAAYFIERIAEAAAATPMFESIDQARLSVVNELFGSKYAKYISNLAQAMGDQVRCSKKVNGFLDSRVDDSLYTQGSDFITLENGENHKTVTRVKLYETGWFPEAYLISQALTTHVFLISATASLPMVYNWDFQFIKMVLGDDYHELRPQTRKTLLELNEERNGRIERGGLDIQVDFIDDATGSIPGRWSWGYSSDGKRRVLEEDEADAVGEIMELWFKDAGVQGELFTIEGETKEDSYKAAAIASFGRQYLSFRKFQDADGARSMISFWPRNMGVGIWRKYIDLMVERIERTHSFKSEKPKLFFPVAATWEQMIRGGSDDIEISIPHDAREESAHEHLEAGGAAFIVTTYATAGFSKNIQFRCSEKDENLIDVFAGKRVGRIKKADGAMPLRDFDSISLMAPTHLLSANISTKDLNPVEVDIVRMKACIEFAKMYEMNELTRDSARSAIMQVFNGGGYIHTHSFESWRMAVAQIVLQASGRLCRARYRHGRTHVLLDSNLSSQFPTNAMKCKPTTLIYDKVRDAIVHDLNAASLPDSKKGGMPQDDIEKAAYAAAKVSNRACTKILRLLHGSEGYTEKEMADFRSVRRQCVMFPTLDRESERNLPANMRLYIDVSKSQDYTNGIVGVDVVYRDDSKGNIRNSRFDFKQKVRPKTRAEKLGRICEESTNLHLFRKFGEFRKHAEELGVPIEWKRNEFILSMPACKNLCSGEYGEMFIYSVLRYLSRRNQLLHMPFVRLEIPELFEKFDFISEDGKIAVDAKNHHTELFTTDTEKDGYLEKVFRKAAECNVEKVLIANCVDLESNRKTPSVPLIGEREVKCADGRIRRIYIARTHGVIDRNGVVISSAMKGVGDFVFR